MLWEKLLKNYTLTVPQFSYLMESWIIWIMREILEIVKFAKVRFGTNSSLALQISLKWTRFWIFYFDNYFYWKYASNTHNSISSILTEKKPLYSVTFSSFSSMQVLKIPLEAPYRKILSYLVSPRQSDERQNELIYTKKSSW